MPKWTRGTPSMRNTSWWGGSNTATLASESERLSAVRTELLAAHKELDALDTVIHDTRAALGCRDSGGLVECAERVVKEWDTIHATEETLWDLAQELRAERDTLLAENKRLTDEVWVAWHATRSRY